ncbi:uncharacterized protein LOC133400140 isoform X2 [Phycodurus eques]|uniref:uncharacterized protein LOC133400140 isoform X2 n=1 Tax=Phycodurus eques TaxID=693459 RepID=UPI002ACE85B0|nr:uncharacterized protein LOC133400140 isoform X2 [Phycodurus eques]
MCLERLRNQGNFTHNVEVLNSGIGTPVPRKRPKDKSQVHNFLHCTFCQGFFLKHALWKHMKFCKFKPSNPPNSGKMRIQALCGFTAPPPPGVKEQLWKLINRMIMDDVYEAVKSDPWIMEYGQHLYNRHGHDATKHEYIRQQMRALGRLLVCSRKNTPMKTIKDHMRPSNFMRVVQAAKDTAGYNCETHTYKSPSLALKIGYSLERISKLVESHANVRRNDSTLKDAKTFRTVYKTRWNKMISSASLKTLKASKWNAPQLLPFTEDVQTLHSFLDTQQQDLFRKLSPESSPMTYAELTKVILTQIILFNRPRAGEVSKIPLSAYLSSTQSDPQEDVNFALSDLEKRLFQHFWRIEIRGKADRKVPVLLTPVMHQTLDLLVRKRKECGILPENTYLFARPSSLICYRGSDTLRNFAKVCGAKRPESLSSKKLHKQMGALSQVLNLTNTELDQLANFLGHDVTLQQEFYRLPEGILQLAKISKVLMAREQGRLAQFKGRSLDDVNIDPAEDVHIYSDQDRDPEEPGDAEPAYESDSLVNPVTTRRSVSLPNSKNHHKPLRIKVRQHCKRKKWEKEEVDAVERHLMSFITSSQLPGKRDCDKCLMLEKTALSSRTWLSIKFYVKNRIMAHIQQLIRDEKELPPQLHTGCSSLEHEDPLPPHIKEEEEDPQPPHIKEEAINPNLPNIKEEQKHPQPADIKENEEDPKKTHVKEEEDPQLPHIKEEEEEFDLSKLPLTGGSVKSKEEPPEGSELHHHSPSVDHCGGPPPDNLMASLSDSDKVPLTRDKDCKEDVHMYSDQDRDLEEPGDAEPAYESDSLDIQQLISDEEELHPQLHGGCSSLEHEEPLPPRIKGEQKHPQLPHVKEEEDPHLPHVKKEQEDPQLAYVKVEKEDPKLPNIKEEQKHPQPAHIHEEEEDPQLPHIKEEEEEFDVSKLPLTGGSVKSIEEKPPEGSELHHHCLSEDHCGGPPPDNLMAPLSDSDKVPLTRDKDCKGRGVFAKTCFRKGDFVVEYRGELINSEESKWRRMDLSQSKCCLHV